MSIYDNRVYAYARQNDCSLLNAYLALRFLQSFERDETMLLVETRQPQIVTGVAK